MSSLSIKYYTFLNRHSLSYGDILDTFKDENTNLRNWSTQHDFINSNIDNTLIRYPKYLRYNNVINFNNSTYNQNKIINTTTISYDQLTKAITDSNVYVLLSNINNYASNYDDLNKEYIFQKNYFTSISDYYNKNLFTYNYLSNDYYKNISVLLNNSYDTYLTRVLRSTLDKQSFFHLYFLKSLISYIFEEKCNLKNILLTNITDLDIDFDISSIFTNTDIYEEIIKVILINQYQFTKLSTGFLNTIKSDSNITTSINDIKDAFNDFLAARSDEFKLNLVTTLFDFFNNKSSFDFFNKIFNSSSVFNFTGINRLTHQLYANSDVTNEFRNLSVTSVDYVSTLTDFEQQIVSFHEASLNNFYSLKQYFYTLYLVRDNYEKFINSINHVASTYVYNVIRTSDIYYFNNFAHLENLFNDWLNNFYYNNFERYLQANYIATKQQLSVTQDISKFAFIYEIYKIIEEFIASEECEAAILNFQDKIFSYLRARGLVEETVDWCSVITPIKVYLMSFLKDIIHDFEDTTLITTYLVNSISETTYSYFESKDDFIDFATHFSSLHSENMYLFFENFLKSLAGSLFSKAIHDLYKK